MDRKLQELSRAFEAGDTDAGLKLAQHMLRAFDVLSLVTGMDRALQEALAVHVHSAAVVDKVAEKIANDYRGEIVSEVAEYYNAADIAAELDAGDIGYYVDAYEVANALDTGEIARELDFHSLAQEVFDSIDVAELASRVANQLADDQD